jgi:hypothetical protein
MTSASESGVSSGNTHVEWESSDAPSSPSGTFPITPNIGSLSESGGLAARNRHEFGLMTEIEAFLYDGVIVSNEALLAGTWGSRIPR